MFFLCFQAVFKHSCCRVRGHSLAAETQEGGPPFSLRRVSSQIPRVVFFCSRRRLLLLCRRCSRLLLPEAPPCCSPRPGRQVTLIGSDGLQYIFLAKPKDDLRKVSLLRRLASAPSGAVLIDQCSTARDVTTAHLPDALQAWYATLRRHATTPLHRRWTSLHN